MIGSLTVTAVVDVPGQRSGGSGSGAPETEFQPVSGFLNLSFRLVSNKRRRGDGHTPLTVSAVLGGDAQISDFAWKRTGMYSETEWKLHRNCVSAQFPGIMFFSFRAVSESSFPITVTSQ